MVGNDGVPRFTDWASNSTCLCSGIFADGSLTSGFLISCSIQFHVLSMGQIIPDSFVVAVALVLTSILPALKFSFPIELSLLL